MYECFFCKFKETYGNCLERDAYNDNSIFNINFWFIYQNIIKRIPKTNNAIEGWNRSLNNNIYHTNPSLYEIGMELKKQHAIVEYKLARLLIENIDDNNDENNYDKLYDVVMKYEAFYGIDFLKAVASLLSFKEP
ncbi:hypothetical protein DMUE_3634 [Dictyocoela muelleri]|nr:hypothetical protein DMUE_3634 [Dictyocoela muelleri]